MIETAFEPRVTRNRPADREGLGSHVMNRLLSAALAVLAVTAWSSEGWARKTARHKCDVTSWVDERLDNWKQQLARSTPADPAPIVATYDRRHGVLLPTCANGPLTTHETITD